MSKTKAYHINPGVKNTVIRIHRGIYVLKAKSGDASKQGIHLLNPNKYELDDALNIAERNMFNTIYIHNNKTWRK